MKCRYCNAMHPILNKKTKRFEHWCYGVPEPFILDDIDRECTEYKDKNEKENKIRIYEDDNWIIEKIKTVDDEYIIISLFRDYHFVEDIRISKKLMSSDEAIDLIKEIIIKEEIK